MAGRIDQFLSHMNDEGVAKAAFFDVWIPAPPVTMPGGLIQMRCEAAELPGRSFTTQDVRIYGPIYRTVSQSVYNELTLTFIETQTMAIRTFFETWMNLIYNSKTNAQSYPDDFVTDVWVHQYDATPNDASSQSDSALQEVMRMNLHRAFPTAVNPMTTAWSDDAFHRVQVTLVYEWYDLQNFPLRVDTDVDPMLSDALPSPTPPNEVPLNKPDTSPTWDEIQAGAE